MARVTAQTLKTMKRDGQPVAMLTAYDYPSARLMDEAGVDAILVGDSCANAVMGRPNTLSVTVDEMLHHVKMVSAAAQRAMVVADMPFLSYQISREDAVRNAGRFIAEGGAHAVKLEGPADKFGPAIAAILDAGIPVMGHIGLTPQSVHQIGGYKVQGRDAESRARLKQEAHGLEAAGCFALVLECMPVGLAAEITGALAIPTIGIGAGASCDGQILVMHDILGFGKPKKMAKVFGDVSALMRQAFEGYIREVKEKSFPSKENELE